MPVADLVIDILFLQRKGPAFLHHLKRGRAYLMAVWYNLIKPTVGDLCVSDLLLTSLKSISDKSLHRIIWDNIHHNVYSCVAPCTEQWNQPNVRQPAINYCRVTLGCSILILFQSPQDGLHRMRYCLSTALIQIWLMDISILYYNRFSYQDIQLSQNVYMYTRALN